MKEENQVKAKKSRIKQVICLFLLVTVVAALSAVGMLLLNPFAHLEKYQEVKDASQVTAPVEKHHAEEPIKVKLFVGGDIVFHPITYSSQYEKVVPPYDFSHMFKRLSHYIEAADYSTITFETVCDEEREYNGFPLFNTPAQAISEIHAAGFDAFATASNHCLDTGFQGMEKTLKKMDEVGVKHFGTKLSEEDKTLIADVKGVKIAFLNYADAYNGLDESLTPGQRKLISPLEINEVCSDIKQARTAGADIVAVYPHWGIEYQTLPNDVQITLAHQMAEAGADIIIGSHPHVMQPAEWVENGGRKTYIVYSLGNAMSNQREKFLDIIDTEIGAFADITIVKDEKGARIEGVNLLPSTVYVHSIEGKLLYEAALIQDLLHGQFANELSDSDKEHISRLEKRAEEILSGKIISK